MTDLSDVHTEAFVAAAFKTLEFTALSEFRCPENGTCGINSRVVMMLALRGMIRVEISGYNYRTVVILSGPHAGASTAPNPKGAGARTWKIIDADGMRRVAPFAHEMPDQRRINRFRFRRQTLESLPSE